MCAVERLLAGGDVAARDQLQGFVGAGLLGEDASLGELAEPRGALGAAAFDVVCRQADCHDDPADRQQHDDRCRDQPEVELPVRAREYMITDPTTIAARASAEQRETDHRQRPDARAGLVDPGQIGGVDLLGAGKQLGLHQRRRLPQVRRSDREALHVVGARGLDQARVGRQLRRHLRERLAGVGIGAPGGRVGQRRRGRRPRAC